MNTLFSFHKEPRLTLVGAGPGDPELITLKGIKALECADVVLFDALVGKDILAMVPPSVPTVCVGKRAGQHSYSQDEINELAVDFAYLYGHVVRLKGGDPFVFGRGGEEMEYAIKRGVRTEVVPGISSALAVPASANIPVTLRGVSESFWVVTGTTMSGELSRDIGLAAQSSATIVILMGVAKLAEIVSVFSRLGKEKTPIAVVQNGTLVTQKAVIGTIDTIVNAVATNQIGSPAVIVVGEVVAQAERLSQALKQIASETNSLE